MVTQRVDQNSTKEYFDKLRFRLKTGFLAAFVAPLVVLSFYFHFQFVSTLKQAGKLHLTSLAESQRTTVDLFLQERVLNVFNLLRSSTFNVPPSQEDMNRYIQDLRQNSDAFVDVGFCNTSGVQIGYAGPFPHLIGTDYSNENWFRTVMDGDKNYYISDIYLGFRNQPHFTIAVRQYMNTEPFVMRATLDPDKFYLFLRNIGRGENMQCALINADGYYQLDDTQRRDFPVRSDHMPPRNKSSGVEEVQTNGDSALIAFAWLNETPWVLVVRQPLRLAYAQMYRARRIMIVSSGLIVVGLVALSWTITNRVLSQAQATAVARERLQSELVHASKLASIGELAAGVAHEINNPLAIIGATSGVIRDLFDPDLKLEWTPETITAELSVIDTAVFRARDITQKLLDFSRKKPQRPEVVNVSDVLDSVVAGLKEREFRLSNIELVRDYDPGLPEITVDPDQLGQVFLNLINNAGDAISGAGTITLAARRDENSVRISISDNGTGMTSEVMQKMFVPFYTTKEVGKGTGLGLSISLSIVESMGGTIEVQSVAGAGSSFTVVLPVGRSERSEHEHE